MAGITTAQSLRFAELSDPISDDFSELLAKDIARELDALDVAKLAALKRPVAQVSGVGQAIPVSTTYVVQYNTEVFDSHNMVNLGVSNTRITVSTEAGPGLYLVSFTTNGVPSVSWTATEITLRKNGGNQVRRKFYGGGVGLPEASATAILWYGAVSDYIDVSIWHDGGASESMGGFRLTAFKLTTN